MMKVGFLIVTLGLTLTCSKTSRIENTNSDNALIADQFVDAFYSFDRDSLQSILSYAVESQPNILYYQKWAECGNYKVIDRSKSLIRNDSVIIRPVTVKDDLMGALQIDFNVTDTFHIKIVKGQIRSIETTSNDLPIYYEAKEWVKKNRPELVEKPCEGIWDGGPTPCECIQGTIKGFGEFVASKKSK